MKFWDIIILLAALTAGMCGMIFSVGPERGNFIHILTPSGDYRYSMSKDREITVTGLNGKYVVEIKEGRVRAREAICPEQICIKRGWVSRSGDSIICLPNRIIIKIENQKQEIDAIVE